MDTNLGRSWDFSGCYVLSDVESRSNLRVRLSLSGQLQHLTLSRREGFVRIEWARLGVTFWSVTGQKLGTYNLVQTAAYQNGTWVTALYPTLTVANVYFGGRLISNGAGNIVTDRLGSVGKFYPWGQEKPSATTNGTEKFTGYFRDAETGLDYADQRYHQPGMGRFLTPDPDAGSAHPEVPSSWSRYSYVGGDPINFSDPSGLDQYCGPNGTWMGEGCYMSGGGTGVWDASVHTTMGGPCTNGTVLSLLNPTTLVACQIYTALAYAPPPPNPSEPNCASAFVGQLTSAPHYDVLYRVLNENSYGLGAKDLSQEDLYIVSVLQNRAATPGAGNLSNGQDSRNIDNQARYAGNPASTNYNYANLGNLISAKYNLPLSSADCQSFLQDISTAQQAITQVLTSGSVNTSVFFWYTKGFNTSNLPWVGSMITSINNNSFYGLP